MNCPICGKTCQEKDDHGYYTKYFCYCDQEPTQEILPAPNPSFTAFRKFPGYPGVCYFYEFNFRQPNKLWMNFSYGTYYIWYFDNNNFFTYVVKGSAQLDPWEGYKLLQRYQELNPFI